MSNVKDILASKREMAEAKSEITNSIIKDNRISIRGINSNYYMEYYRSTRPISNIEKLIMLDPSISISYNQEDLIRFARGKTLLNENEKEFCKFYGIDEDEVKEVIKQGYIDADTKTEKNFVYYPGDLLVTMVKVNKQAELIDAYYDKIKDIVEQTVFKLSKDNFQYTSTIVGNPMKSICTNQYLSYILEIDEDKVKDVDLLNQSRAFLSYFYDIDRSKFCSEQTYKPMQKYYIMDYYVDTNIDYEMLNQDIGFTFLINEDFIKTINRRKF